MLNLIKKIIGTKNERELKRIQPLVGEINSLIDEARTPLIISGPAEESTDKYYLIDRIVPKLQRGAVIQGDPSQEKRAAIEAQGDYTVDEKSRTATLTESGISGDSILHFRFLLFVQPPSLRRKKGPGRGF